MSPPHFRLFFTVVLVAGFLACDDSTPSGNHNNENVNQANNSNQANNLPPEILNLPTTESGHEGASDSFQVLVSDPEGGRLDWSLTGTTCSFAPTIDEVGRVTWTCGGVETCDAVVRVTDDGTPSGSDSGTLMIACTNTAPELTSAPPNSALAGQEYRYSVVCTDVDADPLTLVVEAVDTCGGALVDAGDGTGEYAFTPDVEAAGTTCQVAMACSDGADIDHQTATVTIHRENHAPEITSTPPAEAAEGEPYAAVVACADPDGDPISIGVGVGDTCGGSVTEITYRFTPGEASGGTSCVMAVECSDGAESTAQTITVNISEVNSTPEITGGPLSTSTHWGTVGGFLAEASDADQPAQALTWSLSGSTCVGFTPVVDAATGEVTYVCGGVETCTAEVTVTDDGTPSRSATRTLALACTNTAPELNGDAPTAASEGTPYTWTVTCPDPDGDPVTVRLAADDTCDGTVTGSTYTFTPDESDGDTTCTAAVTCEDGQAAAEPIVQVSIAEVNTAPEITTTGLTSTAHWTGAGSIDLHATDVDLPEQALAWSLSGITCASLVPEIATGGLLSFQCVDVETCTVDVTVTDDGTPTRSATRTLTLACTNSSPVITSGPVPERAYAGQIYAYEIPCTDVDDDELTFSVGPTDTCGGVIDPAGRTYRFIPTAGQAGTVCRMELTCSDSRAADSRILDLAIAGAGEPLWARTGGGYSTDEAMGVAVDDSGDIVVAGSFWSVAQFGTVQLTSAGITDIFVAKYTATGDLVWAVRAGGSGSESVFGVAVDGDGGILVTGYFQGTTTIGTTTFVSQGVQDLFVAKFDTSGNSLWARAAGGPEWDYAYGIAIDGTGNTYITGTFAGTAQFGASTLTSAGQNDVFVAKYDPAGALLWVRQGGGTSADTSLGIAAEPDGDVVITGQFMGAATFGTHTVSSAGGYDAFVARYSAAGDALWAVSAGGSSSWEGGYAVAVDGSGSAWVTGSFMGTATIGSNTLVSAGEADAFLVEYDASGVARWATRLGGPSYDTGLGVTIGADGAIFLTGRYQNGTTIGTTDLTAAGGYDVYVAKLAATGTPLWARNIGGARDDNARGIAVDASGGLYVTGYFTDTAQLDPFTLISNGGRDAFVARYLQ